MTKNVGNQFSLYSHNIRSLPNKWSDFSGFIQELNCDNFNFSVIGLQEIWNIPAGVAYTLPGYHNLIYKTRDSSGTNNNIGGGIGFFIDKNYSFEIIENISIFEPRVFESLFIKVKVGKKFKIIGNIYRPNTLPYASLNKFNEYMNTILHNLQITPDLKNCTDFCLIGDFNIDLIKYKSHKETAHYLESLLSAGLLPLITKPTRIASNSASLIDHISTTYKSDNYNSGILLSDISDHNPVFYIQPCSTRKSAPVSVKARQINSRTIPKFKEYLSNLDYSDILNTNDPAQAFSSFFKKINTGVDTAFPEKIMSKSFKNIPLNPWMTPALLVSRKQKLKLAAKKLCLPNQLNIEKYKNYNKMYNKLIRKAKYNYYENKFNLFSKDIKNTWSTIREVLGTHKKRESIPQFFKVNNSIIEGTKEIANGFNTFFSNIGSELSNKIGKAEGSIFTSLGPAVESNFMFCKVTPLLIQETVGKMKPKTSSGPDLISSKLLKMILPEIITPLCHIINLSFRTGYVPPEFKIAKVIPVFKAEDKHQFTNYRPISLLSTFSKLIEKIVAKQMVGFLNKNKILYNHQYGFRSGFNTTQPVVHFLNKIYSALNKLGPEYTLSIFLDLSKAFDTVNHDILLQKMQHYGFHGVSQQWFKNYLLFRQQYVSVNGMDSDLNFISCGVPQGSVLGPILFLIFINDLPNATNLFTLLFADDTTFQLCDKNLQELITKGNNELSKAANWFKLNKLTLNVSKTKFIIFRNKNMVIDPDSISLKIGHEIIERIGQDCAKKSYKFVGHLLDEFLTWEPHINHIQTKLGSGNYAISKCKNILPLKIRKMLYNSLVKPHLENGIIFWGGLSKSKKERIFKMQKKCIRNLAGKEFRAHTSPLFKYLNLLKVHDIYKLNSCLFMHKICSGKHPDSFSNMFTPLCGNNRTNSFLSPSPKSLFLSYFPSASLPTIWNSLTIYQKNIKSYNVFKKELSSFLKSCY